MKYIEWLNVWLENYIKPSVKVRTYERYALIIEKHIAMEIGGKDIESLSALCLQDFITHLLNHGNRKNRGGLAANSVNAVISVVQNSLRTAHLLGLIGEYTADKIKRPKLIERPVECFNLAEQKQIEQAVLKGTRDKLYGIVLCLYSGLRIGELLALQWKDIDLCQGLLSVSKSCHDSKNGLVFDEPKTVNSRRLIPIPKQLLPILKTIKKRSNSDFFVSSNGSPIAVRSYQRSFELLLVKLNIPHKGFHSLRHTFATRALYCVQKGMYD